MDKDELFKQLEEPNSVSFEEYFSNLKWQEESALVCQLKIQREKEYKILSYVPKDKTEKAESNIMKSYSHLIEDSYFTDKINKEFEEMITEQASMLATSLHDKNDEHFERKVNLYDIFILGYSGEKLTTNQLIYNRNPFLEKQLLKTQSAIQGTLYNFDPSNWNTSPSTLNDLLNHLSIFQFGELFHQPIDIDKENNFSEKAIDAIKKYDNIINENGQNNKEDNEAFIKSVTALLTIEIYKGNFCKLYRLLFQLSQLKNKQILNSIFNDLNNDKEEQIPSEKEQEGSSTFHKSNILLNAITSLFNLASENNYLPYPIMRNYSIVDYFNLSQIILYAKGKQLFSDCSICSDGTYIYAIITGVNGCKMKIGTGFNGTTRGKVYKHIIMPDEASYQWVYCKGKIYLKSFSLIFPLKEFGYLRVISPETLEEEGKIKLSLPKNISHSLVSIKNENFVLLSDGNEIGILVLEPSFSNKIIPKEQCDNNGMNENEDLILNNFLSNEELIKQIDHLYSSNKDNYKYINLELITYNPQPKGYTDDISANEKMIVKEIYDSFNMYYTIDECHKALVQHKWKIHETAEYLSTNPIEIKQKYLEGSDAVILFQSKFELSPKPGKAEKVMFTNPYFDVMQFNYLKWSLTDKHVIAHQIKEGACAIFSRYQFDTKTFTYSTPSVIEKVTNNLLLKEYKDINKSKLDQVTSKIQQLKELFEKTAIELKHGKETMTQSVKGTLIQVTSSIQLCKYDYLSTYDNIQKCYFLLTTASLSCQSILVVDTFINTAMKFNQMIFNDNDINIPLTNLSSFFTSLMSNKESSIDFDALLANLFRLILIMTSSKKYDSYWRYSNWNFSYDYIIEKAISLPDSTTTTTTSSFSSSLSVPSSANNSNEYSQPFIPFVSPSTVSKKELSLLIEKEAEKNKANLLNQIPKELKDKCNVVEVTWNNNPSESNSKKRTNRQYPSPYIKNCGNWISDILLMLKSKGDNDNQLTIEDAMKVKDDIMILDNKRQFYMSIDGDINSIDCLLCLYYQSDSSNRNSDIFYLNKRTIMQLIYLWISNYNDTVTITNPNRSKKIFKELISIIDKYINKKQENDCSIEKDICIKMLIEGWEHLASDYGSQIKWLRILYEYQRNTYGFDIILNNSIEQNIIQYGDMYPFSILLQKIDMCKNSNALLNNFNKINVVKCYSFYPLNYLGELRLIAKPSYLSLSSKHIQVPFHWGLLDFKINTINLPSEQFPILEYGASNSNKSDDAEEKLLSSYSRNSLINSKERHIQSVISKIPNKSIIKLYKKNNEDNNEESIWSFINSIITADNSDYLIEFLNKMFSLALVDLNRIYNEFISQSKNTNDNHNAFFEMYLAFLLDTYNHITKLSTITSSHKSISYLNLYTNYIYNIFSKINNSTLKTMSVLKEILIKAHNDNNSIISRVSLLNEQGTQIENSKVSEYILSNDETTTISKKISFDSNVIVVSIDFRIAKSDGKNYRDLVCMSEYHASNNCLTNNLNKFGTCYQTQLNSSFEKVFYLKGKEIKIISPSTILHSKSTVAKFNSKSFLKIKAFPYNNQFALIHNMDEDKENIIELINSVSLLQDIEYFNCLIDKNMFKSFDIDKDELLKKDSIAKLGFKSYQDPLIAFDYYYHNIPYNMSNYNEFNLLLAKAKPSSSTDDSEQKVNNDSHEIEGFLHLTRQKIREKTSEPNDFIFLQKLPSFTQKYKTKWNNVELILLNTLLYHLGMYEDFKKAFENNNLIIVEPFFDILGKKLNMILSQMSSKAKEFKHSYDTIKSNIDDFIKKYVTKYDEIKRKLCEEIKKAIKVDKQHKKSFHVYDVKSNISLSSVSTLDDNSKKSPIPKRHSITPVKKKKKINKEENIFLFEKDKEKEKEKEKEALKQKLKINFKDESIGDIIKSYKHYLSLDSTKALTQLKALYKTHKTIIEEEMHNNLYGNTDKIKEICEAHGIVYNESNPSDSIKMYSKYIFDQFTSMIPLKDINNHSIIDTITLENNLNAKSPFNTVAEIVLEKALFLLSLNHYDEKTKEDFPFLERLPSITRENSRTSSTRRTKSKNSEDSNSYLFNPQQLVILRSVMNFFSAQNESFSNLKYILNKQFIRAKIRSISLKAISDSLMPENHSSKQTLTNHTLGIISASVKGDIKNGIESAVLDNSPQYISRIVNYCLNSFISTIEELKALYGNSSLPLHENSKSFLIQVSSYQCSPEKIDHKSQINILFKKAFLALSDINILIKDIKQNIHRYTDSGLFDLKLYSNFIVISLRILFAQYADPNLTKANPIKKYCDDLIRIILTKILSMSSLASLSETIFSELSNELTKSLESKDEDNIAKVLEVIHQMIQNGKDTNCIIKLSSILIDLIEQCDKYEIISLSSRLFLQLFKVTNQSINVTKLFTKIGKLFLFKNIDNIDDLPITILEGPYNIMVQMNSTEIDYQFLVNALYYWEEKYPTVLTTNDQNNSANYPLLTVNEETGYRVEKYSYFDVLKVKTNKMHLLNTIVKEKIAIVTKELTELNTAKNEKKDEKLIDDKIDQLKKEEKYLERVKSHIRLAQDIGENASIRGFALLDPPLPDSLAKEFAELVHKAYNRMLPHFKANLIDNVNLFNDDILYPKMPKKEVMGPGCMNTLKETTKSYVNVTLVNQEEVIRLKDNWKTFVELARKNHVPEDKKVKALSALKHFIPDFSQNTLQFINYNDHSIPKIIHQDSTSGASITISIDTLIHLIYSAYQKDLNGLIKQIRIRLQKLKEEWVKDSEAKYNTLGMLIVAADYYKILHKNSKVHINNSICHVISGGDKSGQLTSDIIYPITTGNSSILKIERIQTNLLDKYKHNIKLLKNIPFSEIADSILFSCDLLQSNEDAICNKNLLHVLLKILQMKKIEAEDLVNYIKKKKDSFDKLFTFLNKNSNDAIWLEQEDTALENEFIESFERIYNKIDISNQRIYSPTFILDFNRDNKYYPIDKVKNTTDIITNNNLPLTNYVKQVPQLSDFSKSNDVLKNIQIFDRYLVMEIFNYCKTHYRDSEYDNSLTQVRNHIANGDLKNAIIDLNTIFDDRQSAPHITLLKDCYDSKEITKEEIYPGNYYLAKLTKKFMRQSKIPSLIKLDRVGIYEVTVLVLIQDNALNQALVLFNDDDCGKITTFWVNSDQLMFNAKPIKMPSSSFPLQLILREYKYLHKRLTILYSKNALHDITNCLTKKQSIYSGNDLLNCLILNNWKKFKLNPVSGVYHIFNNCISVKKNESLDKVYSISSVSNKEIIEKKEDDNLITKLIKGIGQKDEKDSDEYNNEILLDKIISSFSIDNKSALDIILKWCMNKWSSLNKEFHSISFDLFIEYNTTSKDKLRSKDMFHIGILNNKLLALHELFSVELMQHCGIILTFDKKAYLSPHARLTFYSDPYGENMIHEIASIKTVTTNLPICVLNYPKVWVNYMPGTSSFEGRNWDANTCNSCLPCTLSLIPYYWSPLIQLTDYCSSGIFNDIKKESIEYYQKIINELMNHCLEMSLPAEIQRRIFNVTNRAILKCFKFISLLESQINYNKKTISEKLTFIGIEEQSMIKLITKINTFATQNEDKSLSSAYLVEGVEILLSILSFIQIPYTKLDTYLRSNYKFELPIWIEAIMKLGQFLTYMQSNNMLESNIASEIAEQLKITFQFNHVIIIQLKDPMSNDAKAIMMNDLKGILAANNVLIVNYDKDVMMIDQMTILILLDGFVISSLNKEEDKNEEKEEEEPLWMCADCLNENDKDNIRCVFCDGPKKIKPKKENPKKVEKKSHFVKETLLLSALTLKMDTLKANIGDLFKGSTITQCDEEKITQSPFKETLNSFLFKRLKLYMNDKDYYNEKIRLIKLSEKHSKEILNSLEAQSPEENNMIALFTQMMNEKIDFWFEDTSLPNDKNIEIDISLMERIREIIDKKVSKDSKYSLIVSPTNLRILPLNNNSINHSSLYSLNDVPLSILRYYWAVIQYFNKCLEAALPYIKPPDYYSSSIISSSEEGYVSIPFPRTISAFLSSARGIMFSFIKNDLIKEVLLSSEYSDNDIQTPVFKFERLAIANSIEKKKMNQKKDRIENESNNDNDDDDNDNEQILIQYQEEDSMFLQAYEQYKNLDPAFFRIQKVKGDPHIAFKVEFKGELVQGLGGPYRQFFSDISSELNSKLSLLQPTSNQIAKKGDYQDKYTINSCENSRTALNHYEFLGFLMGICIRTGVRLTIDLSSIVWKKIIDEVITLNDIYQFDEGLYSMIKLLTDQNLSQDKFKSYFNLKFEIELTNGAIKELIPNGSNIGVNYNDRIKFVQLAVKHRLSESDPEIDAIRKGISKIIPISLLKLLTYPEIEKLICGTKTVDIALLKRNTKLSFDLQPDSNKVKWLWEILDEISDEDKVKFIKFCWAQERLPSSDEEFSKLQVTFTIKSYTDKNKIDVFPKADTCFFNLELPEYSSKEVMKKKLLQAISLDNIGMNADKVIAEPLGRYESNYRHNYEEHSYNYDYDYSYDYE